MVAETFTVVAETADHDLLARPYRGLDDVAAIEAVPLAERLRISDFCRRVDLGLAARAPDDTAIFYVPDGDVTRPAQRVSFATLRCNIARTAALLRAHGIGREDVVAVLLPNLPQIYWAVLGAMQAGIVFPPNWMLEPAALSGLLRQAGVRAIIALGPTPGFRIWEALDAIRADLPPGVPIFSVPGPGGTMRDDDLDAALAGHAPAPALPIAGTATGAIVHSGGTTGLPKLVRLSHQAMSYRHWTLQLASRLSVGELHFHETPMFHVGGLVGRCLPPLASGAAMLIPSVHGARDRNYLGNYWAFVEAYGVSRLSGVPTSLAVLAKAAPAALDRSSLEPHFVTGSTALPASVRDAFEQACGVRVLNSYGMTENTASIAIDPRDGPRKAGSSGIRLPYTRIRVMALDGAGEAAVGAIGALQITGPGICAGYVNPAHAAAARTPDGWLITGDLGRVDDDGFVFVTGRSKDIIIRGGHNIDPALIEEPLLHHPDILHAAAVGRPDAYAGEVPVAYVQPVAGAAPDPAALLDWLALRITERAALPKEIIVLAALPLSAVGKPLKAELRRDIAERRFRDLLRAATGLADDALDVAMLEDARHGTCLAVTLHLPPGERDAAEAAIATAMAPHATAWRLEHARAIHGLDR